MRVQEKSSVDIDCLRGDNRRSLVSVSNSVENIFSDFCRRSFFHVSTPPDHRDSCDNGSRLLHGEELQSTLVRPPHGSRTAPFAQRGALQPRLFDVARLPPVTSSDALLPFLSIGTGTSASSHTSTMAKVR